MAASTDVQPITQVDVASPRYFAFNEPPLQPPFTMNAIATDPPAGGQNHDRDTDTALPPAPLAPPAPPAPPAPLGEIGEVPAAPAPDPPPTSDPTPPVATSAGHDAAPSTSEQERRASESDEGSGSDHGDSEEEDEQQARLNRWQPIEEDKSEPCEDELAYIVSKGEHSAQDTGYWEKKTFFDLDDPEIFPVASGKIDWLVDSFNGTKESPNKESMMRSPTVTIGDYDWRIKFYPKGNESEYLSVYLECVTMQSEDFTEFKDFSQPPLPFLDSEKKLKQRVSVAVQLGVVMYNPAEPRVYEYQTDAHQFTKQSSDYGWTRFTRYSRREFSYRMHGQRQAILRNDKLAFSAYIRIIHDPTQSMWSHGTDSYNDSIALTGLRPFSTPTPMFAAKIPLLHFAPFRNFIYKYKGTKMVFWLQCVLWKMLSRTRSKHYGTPTRIAACDAIAWLGHITRELRTETDPGALTDLIGPFHADKGSAIMGNKLKTKTFPSVQAAVDNHSSTLATPALLTLELEREEFDRKERKWNKITNKVDIQNRIIVAGTPYILYAFSTHCGDLTSNKFNTYVRPRGPTSLWHVYTDGSVTSLTHKQAVDAHCGFEEVTSPIKESRHSSHRQRRFQRFDDPCEVAHVVYYVRGDYRDQLLDSPEVEEWDVPKDVREGRPPKEVYDTPEPPQTAVGPGEMSAEMAREVEADIERDRSRQNSVDESSGAATPSGWVMDGEDIIMSDVDDEEAVDTNEKDAPSQHLRFGCVIDHLGREYYNGSMLGHLYHGEGHLIYMNGDEYIGNFLGGEKSGKGKMVYARTGNIYEGDWLEDVHHGHGTLTEAKTENIFEGGWKHGRKSGQFVLTGTVTDDDKGCCSICYDKEINTAFYDCGHVLACRECAHKIDTCPICRRRVVARLELFGVKMVFD